MFFLWTASAMTGCARREEVFLEEMDSDEENSNRKAGEESTAYENNVAAGENPEKQSAISDAGSEGNTENSALDLPPETPIPQKIFVDVCGAVVNPGVYELDEGARIFQAVDAAGGYLPEAAINYLNRARSIGDGQQIYVPTEKEVAENLELAMAKVPEATMVTSLEVQDWKKFKVAQRKIHRELLEEILEVPEMAQAMIRELI